MKKTIKIITALLLVLSFSAAFISCENKVHKEEGDTEVETNSETNAAPQTENKGEKYYAYDKMLCYANGEWFRTVEWEYDAFGNVMIQKDSYDGVGGTSVYTTVYTYGDSGKLEKSVWIDEDNSYSKTTTYSYDEKGNLIKEEMLSSDNEIIVNVHSFDTDGKKIKTTVDDKGNVSEYIYLYDENGNMVKKTEKSYLGVEWDTKYAYDENGRLIKETVPDVFKKDSNIVYKYNEKGLLTESVYTHSSGKTVTTYKYEGEHVFYK